MADKNYTQFPVFSGVMAANDIVPMIDVSLGETQKIAAVDLMHQPQFRFQTGQTKPAHQEGLMFYDEENKSVAYYNDIAGTTMDFGQENWIRGINNTGSTLLNGNAIYISGATAGVPHFALASNTATTTSFCIGILTNDSLNGAPAICTNMGVVHDMDTSTFTLGAPLWLNSTAGGLTMTQPSGATPQVLVGFVLSVHATQGDVLVALSRVR